MRENAVESKARVDRVANNVVVAARCRGVSLTCLADSIGITRQTLTDRLYHHTDRLTLGNICDIARKLNVLPDRLLNGHVGLED